jgi:hypothetical protein
MVKLRGPGFVGLFVAVLVSAVGACGSGPGLEEERSAETACGPVTPEPLDASSALHLLPGAVEPTYQSDPPTSGPHLSGRPPTSVLEQAIDRPTQVLVLEEGGVLLQHRDLAEDDVARLRPLAGDQVVVAPNPDLPAPVVATAWLAKQRCEGVDVEALSQFVEDHAGLGPEGGVPAGGEPDSD